MQSTSSIVVDVESHMKSSPTVKVTANRMRAFSAHKGFPKVVASHKLRQTSLARGAESGSSPVSWYTWASSIPRVQWLVGQMRATGFGVGHVTSGVTLPTPVYMTLLNILRTLCWRHKGLRIRPPHRY